MSEEKKPVIGITGDELGVSLKSCNLFRRDKKQMAKFLVQYSSCLYGLPFKYEPVDKNNLASTVTYLAGVCLFDKFHKGMPAPKHFTISKLHDVIKKKGNIIKEVVKENSQWYERALKETGLENPEEQIKVEEDGSLTLENDLLKSLIGKAMGHGDPIGEDYSAIDLLRMPTCRRSLFLIAIEHPEHKDISPEYRMLENFLNNYTDTTIDDIIKILRDNTEKFSKGDPDRTPSLEQTTRMLTKDGVFKHEHPEFDFAPVMHDYYYDVNPDTIVIGRLIYSKVLEVITTFPKKFDAYLSLMECLFSISTLSCSSLVVRNFADSCQEIGVDEATKELINECISLYFMPMTLGFDAIKNVNEDPRIEHEQELKMFDDPIYREGQRKLKKVVQRGGLDDGARHMLYSMFGTINESTCVTGAEPFGKLNPLTGLRVQSIIQFYKHTMGVLANSKNYMESKSSSFFDIYTVWEDIHSRYKKLKDVASSINQFLLARDLALGIVELITLGDLRVNGYKGNPVKLITSNHEGVTGNAVNLVNDNMLRLREILGEQYEGIDLCVSGDAFAEIYEQFDEFAKELFTIYSAGEKLVEMSSKLKKMLASDEFDPVEFKSVSDAVVELKTQGNNPAKLYHDMCPAHLKLIDAQIGRMIDSKDVRVTEAEMEAKESLVKMREERDNLLHKVGELGEKVTALTAKNQSLEAKTKGLEVKADSGEGTKEIPDAVINYLTNGTINNVVDALTIAQHTLGDRVVILPSAMASAQDSEYNQPDRVLREITVLGTMFLLNLKAGGTDVARKLFPTNVYRAGESDTVIQHEKLAAYRRFSYQGEKQMFTAHLALGSSYSKNKHIRVYFKPEIENNRVVIAYCGKHLPSKTS